MKSKAARTGDSGGGTPDGVGDCFEQVALRSRAVNLPCLRKIGQSRVAAKAPGVTRFLKQSPGRGVELASGLLAVTF